MYKDKLGLYKSDSFCCTKVWRNYVRFLLTKKPWKSLKRAKIRLKNLQKIIRSLNDWSLKILGNKTWHVIIRQVCMECVTEPEIFPRLPCIMRVIIVEPFNMERHGCRFLCITRVIKNFLNEILHVVATCCISWHAHRWVKSSNHFKWWWAQRHSNVHQFIGPSMGL